ncbi:hypothetical protein Lalb_Chr04g0261501 [Lupinus albus]|uniref:Uncharacterized protein n=1 Tax=Lupinus albus TaxID=3870 RepID=A0A6A4QR58_LUPAL|nr:hypothetical protein Lalb_Chr04g0261501 [Lupinus albus]
MFIYAFRILARTIDELKTLLSGSQHMILTYSFVNSISYMDHAESRRRQSINVMEGK